MNTSHLACLALPLSLLTVSPAQAAPQMALAPLYSETLQASWHIAGPVQKARAQAGQAEKMSAATPQTRKRANRTQSGCAASSSQNHVSVFFGAQSRCTGGTLSGTERAVKRFDISAGKHSAAAGLALREDPRDLTRVPLNASAGFMMPLGNGAHIGMEYSFSQDNTLSPLHFRSGALPADDLAGHSATVRVGLTL